MRKEVMLDEKDCKECKNTGWQEGTKESGFICDFCDRACSCLTTGKWCCPIHEYDARVGNMEDE